MAAFYSFVHAALCMVCLERTPRQRLYLTFLGCNGSRPSSLNSRFIPMFRRIELIDEMSAEHYHNFIEAVRQRIDDPHYNIEKEYPRFWKSGLMGFGNPVVWDAWQQMNSPRRPVNRNARFYFTEEGWRRYGRKTIEVCQQVGQRYRVLRIKENAVDVIYRDEFQVAVRPRRKPKDK